MDTALVEEHDRQAEEVPHEDYTVEYLGVGAKAVVYLMLHLRSNVVRVRLTSDIRYVKEGRILQDAENNPNADDAGALEFEVGIIAGVSDPIYEPDQDK